MPGAALPVGLVLVLISTMLGGADYYFKERPHDLALVQSEQTQSSVAPQIVMSASSSTAATASGTAVTTPNEGSAIIMSASSSSPLVIKKGVSTKKKDSVDVSALLSSLQFTISPTSESSILQLIAKTTNAQTVVLLLNNDRAALFSWIENDDVKTIFSSVKQALQEQFSPKLTGLIDETQTSDNGPPIDVLAFFDPAISPEKVMFIRVRNRLYEFHIAAKGEAAVGQLIEALSQ